MRASDVGAPSDATDAEARSRVGPGSSLTAIAGWFGRRGPISRGFLAFALFGLASIVIFALPVITDLGHRCVGSCLSDTYLYVWSFEWMHHAVSNGMDPFFTPLVYAPQGLDLAWVTTLPGPALLMLPVTSRFGALVSVNLLMIAAPALAGWAMYLVCVRLTARFWPSIAGGALFAFSPYIGQHMRAHLNLVLIFFVPLAAYLVIRRVDLSMGRVRFTILLALVLAGQLSSSLELFATLTFFGGIAYLGALVLAPKMVRIRLAWTIPLLIVSYAGAALITLPIVRNVLSQPEPSSFRIERLNTADLLSFVVPPPPARIGGAAMTSISSRFLASPQDNTAYVTIVLLVIPVLFLIRFRRHAWAWGLVASMLLVAALSLGSQLHIGGQPFDVPMPQSIMDHLPFIQHALPERFPAYLYLALGVITAIWLAQASGIRAWWRYALVALGLALMTLNLSWEPNYHGVYPVPPFISEGDFHRYLAPDENVLVVPRILGGDLGLQAAAEMQFRLARAYVGPVHPVGHAQVGLRVMLSVPGELLPAPTALLYFLTERDVGAVIVEQPVQPELATLLDGVTGSHGVPVGGVTIWDVPPTALGSR